MWTVRNAHIAITRVHRTSVAGAGRVLAAPFVQQVAVVQQVCIGVVDRCCEPLRRTANEGGLRAIEGWSILRSDAETDRKFLCRQLLDAHSKLINIHTGCGYPDIKQLPRRRLFQLEVPLLICFRRPEHRLPVGTTEFKCYAICWLFCSPNEYMACQRATHRDFFLHDKRSCVPSRHCQEEDE